MPLRALGMWIGQAQRATASGERIFQVIDEPEDIARRAGRAASCRRAPGRVVVRARHVRLRPDAAGAARRRPRARAPGAVVALIGHTGAGKTTLASLVPRFYDVQSGGVTIDGADVRDVTLTSLRREIGVIAQDPFLFSATVRENIAFGRADATDEEVERAARLAQAHEFVEALPDGLRHGDRRARDHALRRPAPARRDRARARRRPAHPDPRRRDRVGRRDDRGEDPRRACARRCAAGRRSSSPPPLDDRARRRDRRARRRPRRRPRHRTEDARANDVYREIDEHGLLERDLRRRRSAYEGPPAGLAPDARRAARRSTTGRGRRRSAG